MLDVKVQPPTKPPLCSPKTQLKTPLFLPSCAVRAEAYTALKLQPGVGLGVGAGAVRPGEGFLEVKTMVRGRRMREFPEEERAGQGVEARTWLGLFGVDTVCVFGEGRGLWQGHPWAGGRLVGRGGWLQRHQWERPGEICFQPQESPAGRK